MKVSITLFIALLTLTSFSQSAEDHYLIAISDVESEKYRRSIKSYSKAIELDKNNAQYFFERGRSYFEIGEYLMAKSDLDEAIVLDSTLAKAYHYRALYMFLIENYSTSIIDNDQAIRYSTNEELTTACLLNRGEAKYLSMDTLGAYEDLKVGLAVDSMELGSIKIMCSVLHDLGKHEEALFYLNKQIQLDPKEIGGYINKGFELEALGKYEEAIVAYNEAANIDKLEPLVLSNRAHAYYKIGAYEMALKDINKSIYNQPLNAFAYQTRALILIEQKEFDKACKDIEAAIHLGDVGDTRELRSKYCN